MAIYETVLASELWDRVKMGQLRGEAFQLEALARKQDRWAQRNREKAQEKRQEITDMEMRLAAKRKGR